MEIQGEPVNADAVIQPLIDAMTLVLRGSDASSMRQLAALLTLVDERLADMEQRMGLAAAPPQLEAVREQVTWWIGAVKRVVEEESLRVRVTPEELLDDA